MCLADNTCFIAIFFRIRVVQFWRILLMLDLIFLYWALIWLAVIDELLEHRIMVDFSHGVILGFLHLFFCQPCLFPLVTKFFYRVPTYFQLFRNFRNIPILFQQRCYLSPLEQIKAFSTWHNTANRKSIKWHRFTNDNNCSLTKYKNNS